MPIFERDGARIHYQVSGEGFPVLLLAPGGMRSAIPVWENAPWNPLGRLGSGYKVIAMDQRNAGQSTAPIRGSDGWGTYRDDQLALLDHLGVDRFHAVGMCIGGSFIMELAAAVPERLAAAVMLQPIGLDGNQQTFMDLFNGWAEERKPDHPDVSDADWARFRAAMFGSDRLLFNASEADVARCRVPLLVLMGNDVYHPEFSSRRVAELAPDARLIEQWKEGEHLHAADAAIAEFLSAYR